MINSNRQTLERENIGFIRIVLIIIASIALMNVVMSFLSTYGGGPSTIGGLFILAVGGIFCTRMIYRNLTNFQYKIIADEIIFERSIGRGNHIILNTQFRNIIDFKKCADHYEAKDLRGIKKFVISGNIDEWYLIHFKSGEKEIKLIIEPKGEFLTTIEGRIENE